MNIYLIIILVISIAGILFSGFLSFKEFSKRKTCSVEGKDCGGQKIAGIPVCVYGLIMYIIIFTISLIGILIG